ncbi:glycosyltransferase [Achromobacter insolitus]|uniref:glycosyltransferase n=1 Tax=Achromobacter insolitus TaxID=217204 RepID=UPI002FE150F2
MNNSNAKKVLVIGHDLKFWRPLQAQLENSGRYEFRIDEWSGHQEHDQVKTLVGMEWADIIVAEWALGNAVFAAEHKRPNQRLIVRLHAQERRTDFPAQIDYKNVDMMIFVGEHIRLECVKKFSIPSEKTRTIGNFVDVKKFQLQKFGGSEFNLGIIGIAPASKRLDLALDTLELLLAEDDRYSLHVKGPSPQSYRWLWARTKEREYYERVFERINSGPLRYKVIFDPAGNDVHRWLQKIGYILSPSDAESFHMAVAEGISSNVTPIIWKWPGSDFVYPFAELVDSAQSAASQIARLNRSNSRPRLHSQASRFVQENYDASVISDKWLDALSSSELQPGEGASVSASSKKGVVVVYSIDKWEMFHRREMLEGLAKNLDEYFDILVVEPGTHYKTILDRGICDKDTLDSYTQLRPVRVHRNIYKMHMIFAHNAPKDVALHPALANAASFGDAVKAAVRGIFGKDRAILHWIYKPDQRPHIAAGERFIYEVYDEYTMNFSDGTLIGKMHDLEPLVLNEAEHVFFTSQPLAARKQRHCRSSSICSNGVAFDVFDSYRVSGQASTEGGRRSVGYLGNLSDFFDWETMCEVVEELPELDFFFHGQVERHRLEKKMVYVDKLLALSNTHFSGRVNRSAGAAACNRYDVLVIPFVVNEAMHAVNPLKLWEYLATGRPVVMTPMDAIKDNIPGLYTAYGTREWVKAIGTALDNADAHVQDRVDIAKAKNWENIVKPCAEILKGIIEK